MATPPAHRFPANFTLLKTPHIAGYSRDRLLFAAFAFRPSRLPGFRNLGMGGSVDLVTGATGYIGGRLIARLRAEGRPVRAMARRPPRFAPGPGGGGVARGGGA